MSNKELIKTQMSGILNLPVESLEDDADLASLVNNSFILIELIIDPERAETQGIEFAKNVVGFCRTTMRVIACPPSSGLGNQQWIAPMFHLTA